MKLSRFHIPVLAVILLLSASCIRRPKHVMSDNEMAPVMADIELAQAYIRLTANMSDSDRNALINGVIEKHGVSREDFDSTMSWYARNIDKYSDLCDLVEKELAKKKRKLAGKNSVEVESADLWPYMRMAYVAPNSAGDGINFSIPTIDVQKGERLQWKLHTFSDLEGKALLGIEYEDGLMSYVSSSLRSKRLDMELQTDTSRVVSRIFGNLVFDNSRRSPVWIDSIALRTLPYDSVEYFSIYSQKDYRNPKARRKPQPKDLNESKDSVEKKETPVEVKPQTDVDPKLLALPHSSPPRPGMVPAKPKRLN